MIRTSRLIKGTLVSLAVLNSTSFLTAQTSCPGFKTYTQGGWGATPSGNNPGTFLDANFASNFPAPTYLTIGCNNKLQLTSAAAVRAFLPNGTIPAVLPAGTMVNKTKYNYSNVFAGQLVALTLNLRFDNNISSFSPSTTNLKDLVIASGPFLGKTVQFLADNANLLIGGCSGYFPKTLAEYTNAIDQVNKNYDNGTNQLSFLACPLVLSISVTPVLCKGEATGTASVFVSGGRAPYNYVWSNNAGNVATVNNLTAGTYYVTVSDASGQIKTITMLVTEPATALIAAADHTDIRCFNESNGSMKINFSGGTAPYTISFNAGSYTAATSPTIFNNLTAGNYSWTVMDANGCLVSGTETLNEPQLLTLNASVTQSIRCFNECNGVITASALGGNGDYSYSWSDGSTNAVKTSVCSGSYTVSVNDKLGCTASGVTVVVDQPEELLAYLAVSGLITCHNDCNGILNASASGGNGNNVFSWSDGTIGNSRDSLCAGDYTVSIMDEKGCSASSMVTLENPHMIMLTSTVTPSTNCEASSCDGSVSLTISGGMAPFSISWVVNGNEPIISDDFILDSLCGGSAVIIHLEDALGCMIYSALESSSSIEIPCENVDCQPLTTYTQGGWGATPSGNNPGVYLHANFDAAFPSGITLGCNNTLVFSSANAITSWLPSGSTTAYLPTGTMVNPTNYNNVLAGQLLAAMLNTGFDNYDTAFAAGQNQLGSMFISSGFFSGITINDLLQLANNAIGGCDNQTSLTALNEALTAFNQNYDNGTVDAGFLTCTNPESRSHTASYLTENKQKPLDVFGLFPNPADACASIIFSGIGGQTANIKIYDLTGRMLQNFNYTQTEGTNRVNLSFVEIENQQCIVVLNTVNQVVTKMVSVQH